MKALSLLLFSIFATATHAIEPWADQALPVQNGLALWLDASVDAKAASAAGVANKQGNVPAGVWHDGSGHKRDARQQNEAARPKSGRVYPVKMFAFDGQAQHFVVRSPGLEWKEATVVVFARANSNPGGFRALISASKAGANDYRSGFNIDFGSQASSDGVDALNIEGPGFGGERNLLKEPIAFGKTFTVLSRITPDRAGLDWSPLHTPTRPRTGGQPIRADEIVIGARSYDNEGGAPTPRGFFHGDIFEVLIYDRAITDEEVKALRTYLTTKYSAVVFVAPTKAPVTAGSKAPVALKDVPVIQPLVPGFKTRKLPVQLSNINVLRYRDDGRLFAGAYNGKIWLLRDTDGDGLEDKADVFYESSDLKLVMGMALTPPGYARGEGVFVSTGGRILLILDKDANGKGDEVITVASGWTAPKNAPGPGGASDVLGIAVTPDGRVYFNLGTSDFTNPYLLDAATGKSGFDVNSERGTVQEVSADFKTRTTVANGLRFLVGMAIKSNGDLFATEQEGATWLANGNPFDELLHIQAKRYYGFPPHHPQRLPGVIDEPSTFDYGPQHQSTVGLTFDEPVKAGGRHFGPGWWQGDALVAAMSRGKIYRTKLVKTDVGYVAKNETFAQLQRIIIDQAVTPRGGLTVTLHSGGPDWGTGPTGTGELWQIEPSAENLPPQPVLAWSASPTELRVVFDQPLDTAALAAMRGKVRVTQGRYVQAGDRFETMRPGYQVVKNERAAPRYPITVHGVALADEAHTLVVSTAERSAAVNYGITIEANPFSVSDKGAYSGQIDLLADLTGLDAEWRPETGAPLAGWLPHPDFKVARALHPRSPLWSRLAERGSLTLRGQLDLGLMLYPAIQEGSKLDWNYPDEKVTVVLEAARPFTVSLANAKATAEDAGGRFVARREVTAKAGSWFNFTVAFASASGDPDLRASWFTDRSATPRPLPLRRVLVPYAQQQDEAPEPRNDDLPELVGGNWNNGATLFKAMCAACHRMRGEGAKFGPDLSNLIYRDYDSVLRDIREPSAVINPEHVGYTVKTKDGEEITAVWIAEGANSVTFALAGGQKLEIPRANITEITPLAVSVMPAGLDQALNPTQLRDLMSYLLLPPLQPAPLTIPGAPAPRKLSEVKTILGDKLTAPMETNAKSLRIVLCASEKDKGHASPGIHDYPLWRSRWTRLLAHAPGIHVEQADLWPSAEQWRTADVIAINSHNPAWSLATDPASVAALGANMDAFLARGGGLVFVHWAVNAGPHAALLAQRLGLAWSPASRYRHGAEDWILDLDHPLAVGFKQWRLPDESYWNLTGDLEAARASVLVTSVEEKAPRPQMWTREVGPGRVFVSVPGHYTWTHDDPLYRILILRGMMWTAKQPIDRLAPLSIVGARVEN